EGSNQISVNELPAGTYLMQIKVENEIIVERVVRK
ncbi:MAG: T9SS type A sorting domain-containing protein, partial [Paludibacteraceae bacterium]|nr:T9SS type A sorting domain-containing protein [Paludibacteraceae bacterium]